MSNHKFSEDKKYDHICPDKQSWEEVEVVKTLDEMINLKVTSFNNEVEEKWMSFSGAR
jgi:hypothetical protein